MAETPSTEAEVITPAKGEAPSRQAEATRQQEISLGLAAAEARLYAEFGKLLRNR